MMKEKVVFCWSGGKDSALALNRVLRDDRYEVVSLLTTQNFATQLLSPRCIRRRKNRVAIAPAGALLKKNVSGF
jgi:diphthamide synthase (EF-2-diphthine--ammonia ligase)